MKSCEDVAVEHLVADTGAFLKYVQLQNIGAKVYTTQCVIDELKCSKSQSLLESLPYELIIREPTSDSLLKIVSVSKKTGDYAALSKSDLRVLALTHDLHIEFEKTVLDYECKNKSETKCNAASSFQVDVDMIEQTNEPELVEMEEEGFECSSDDDSSSDSSEGRWINENNINEILHKIGNDVVVPAGELKVACITTDFAMQNVMLHMGLHLLSCDGLRIRQLKSYVLMCRACYMTTSLMTRQFCSRCGHNILHRIAVTVNVDGTLKLHVNWNRFHSKRGLVHSKPLPKGGKHEMVEQLFEDQRLPQNRMARCIDNPCNLYPFTVNDVTSKSAVLGIRKFQQNRRSNPNMPSHGRKRGNKRR